MAERCPLLPSSFWEKFLNELIFARYAGHTFETKNPAQCYYCAIGKTATMQQFLSNKERFRKSIEHTSQIFWKKASVIAMVTGIITHDTCPCILEEDMRKLINRTFIAVMMKYPNILDMVRPMHIVIALQQFDKAITEYYQDMTQRVNREYLHTFNEDDKKIFAQLWNVDYIAHPLEETKQYDEIDMCVRKIHMLPGFSVIQANPTNTSRAELFSTTRNCSCTSPSFTVNCPVDKLQWMCDIRLAEYLQTDKLFFSISSSREQNLERHLVVEIRFAGRIHATDPTWKDIMDVVTECMHAVITERERVIYRNKLIKSLVQPNTHSTIPQGDH